MMAQTQQGGPLAQGPYLLGAVQLLKALGDGVLVDLLDRLPTPYGLVRSGVAPDHQDTKNVTHQFAALGQDPRCAFYGNVTLGQDVALSELRERYHAVVLSYGAESDKRLNIPGEDAPGVLTAREFVWWYNAHPDAEHLAVDLSQVRSVAICGVGNVALDCARLLLQPAAQLEPTDVATHALRQLQGGRNAVRDVHLVARRGPGQAACTPKELKELLAEPRVVALAAPDQLAVSQRDLDDMKAVRMRRRIYDLISKAVASGGEAVASGSEAGTTGAASSSGRAEVTTTPGAEDSRRLHFQFYRQPVEVVLDPGTGRAAGVRVEVTQLQSTADGQAAVAVGTGRYEVVPAQLVLKSIGYRSLPVEGAAFDGARGVIPNKGGRALKEVGGSEVDPGLYVCGWLKRGPSGIIGTNLIDAQDTVTSMVEDAPRLLLLQRQGVPGPAGQAGRGSGQGRETLAAGRAEGLAQLLRQRGVRAVSFADWEVLDAAEVAAGGAGRVREKVVNVAAMLAVCDAAAAVVAPGSGGGAH